MVKPIVIAVGAIPAIIALLIAIPMVTKPEIPITAVDPNDQIELEFTKHQLKISFEVEERVVPQKTEILLIQNDGKVRYTLTEDKIPQPDKFSTIDENKLRKITALIKETGFMLIPSESFPVREDADNYQKSTLRITLNGETKQIHWVEQNFTDKFVPPIITMVESELNQIIEQVN